MRAGVVVAASGFGTGILGLIMSAVLRGPDAESALIVCGLGVIAFALGLGLVLNGLLFTKPRKRLEDHSSDARAQNLLDAGYTPPLRSGDAPTLRSQTTSNLAQASGSSITEHTTQHLKTER